jgi:hypothetical protein
MSTAWPGLPFDAWKDTYATLHLWLQIVGKVRLTLSPWINHSWNATFYVTARGLSTSPISSGVRTFEIEFDFIRHQLEIRTSDGLLRHLPLEPEPVAAFYRGLMAALAELDLPVRINLKPNEVAEPIAFDRDERHKSYDAESAARFWQVLVQTDRVFKMFRGRFIGKCSPVHFFWGAPDLAVTRFSGDVAPEHAGGVPNLPDAVAKEAYSHQVSSCGFWPGGGPIPYPVFYAYAYPEPPGFAAARVGPAEAFYSTELHEFLLPYDAVADAEDPDAKLLEFLQTTYEAAANLGAWNRSALERP